MKMKRWTIVHEDEDVIVINKPPLYLSIPDQYDNGIPNIKGILQERIPAIFVTHRLEKETSGLVLFTKNAETHKILSDQFENKKFTKIYKAIVTNTPTEPVGQIDLAMNKTAHSKKGMALNAKGKAATTKYRILETFDNYCYLDIKLLTDRMHQIRLHMSSIYCPLACDSMYGDGQPVLLSRIKRKYRRSGDKENPLMDRTALHASDLEFTHPRTNEKMSFSADLPKDMNAVLYQLRKSKK
ncbi:RluA family pseudouridine synthase [Saprospiraceae bacterium]|nr:RluA family pseudouridine synthase [Saprospiraceae bacterium]